MYADDHQLFLVAKSISEVENTLNEGGNKISEWYYNNLLQGNFSKYQAISLGPKNCPKDLQVAMKGTVTEQKS